MNLKGLMCIVNARRFLYAIGVVCCASINTSIYAASGANGTYIHSQQTDNVKVNGSVREENGSPIIGASVIIVGTATGVATDIDGNFTINVPKGAKLKISYIGFIAQEITINDQEQLKVILKSEDVNLEEVVVTGFGGVQKIKTQTASAVNVPIAKLAALPLTSMSSGLGGRVTGVTTQERSGMPGETAKIWIRGGSSVLYVIDDVIMETEQGEIFFNRLRPNDIESMSILKDASATAVYGPRAEDGVIVVTTKKGAAGVVDINVNQKVSIMTPSYRIKSMSILEYAEWRNELALANYVQNPPFTQDQLAKWYMGDLGKKGTSYSDMANLVNNRYGTTYTESQISDLFDPEKTQGGNIQDYFTYNDPWKLFDHTQPMSQTTLNVRGGSERLRYYSSAGYMKQKGIYKTFDYEQINLMLNTDAYLLKDKSLKFTVNLNGVYSYKKRPTEGENVFRNVMFYNNGGTASISNYWSTGRLRQNGPLARMMNGSNNTRDYRAQGKIGLKWSLPWIEGLSISGSGSFNTSYSLNKAFSHTQIDVYSNPLESSLVAYNATNAQLTQSWSNYMLTTGQVQADYGHQFGKHNVSGLLNYTSQVRRTNNSSTTAKGFATIYTPQISSGASVSGGSGGETVWGTAFGVFRVSYDYDNKYLLQYSANYNASLSYSPAKRWGFFQAASAGWVVTEEKFFKDSFLAPWINMFKLRFGYGIVGGEIGSPFSYLNQYAQSSNRVLTGNSMSETVAWQESNVANDLTWSKSRQMTGGVDFGALKNRFTGSVDVFLYKNHGAAMAMNEEEVRTDILGMPNTPQINAPFETNRKGGYEIQVRWEDKIGANARYYAGLNWSYWDQRVTRHPTKAEDWSVISFNDLGLRALHPVYQTAYATQDGLWGSYEDIYKKAVLLSTSYSNYIPGTIKWDDRNGNGRLDAGDYYNLNTPGTTPLTTYGITLGGSWKGIEVELFFQGATNVSGALASPIRNGEAWLWNYGKTAGLLSYSPSNPNVNAALPIVYGGTGLGNLYVDRYAFDASYFKMKNLAIRYDLKNSCLKNVDFFKMVEVSFVATNLFTVTKKNYPYKNLADPEFLTSSGNMYGSQGNLGGYPTQRSYTLGVSLSF